MVFTKVTQTATFPIACVGGAEGSLRAFTELLRHLPVSLGMAIVIVDHRKSRGSKLAQILQAATEMPVRVITDKLVIEPNKVYVIPADRDLHVVTGRFLLRPTSKPTGWPDVITIFLKGLAEHWSGQIIAIILSGLDGDGAAALKRFKEVGGITIAQRLDGAEQRSMPETAIGTNYIDMILSPAAIAYELARIAQLAEKRTPLRSAVG